MMKEYGLMLLNNRKSAFLREFSTVEGTLKGKANYSYQLLGGVPLKVNNEPEFLDSSLNYIKGMASMMNEEGETENVPVIVEVEYTIKGLDGTEYDLEEIQGKTGKNDFKQFLEALANTTN